MFKKIIKYSNKYFLLFKKLDAITDNRIKPQIPSNDIAASVLSLLFANLGSLNKFNLYKNNIAANTAGRIPSASTIGRAADTMDLDALREILKSIYLKAKRSKMFSGCSGNLIGIIDAHEIFSSDIHWCKDCSIRNVSKIEGEVKLNYYHKYSAFILAGKDFAFLLDIEPIYPNEGELTSSQRLLERVCKNYHKAFEVVAGDALYLNGPVFNLLSSHHKYAAAVLKDERRYLFDEAISLSEITAPLIYKEENTTYKVWDHRIEKMWDSCKDPVRVIKSEECKTVRRHMVELGRWEYQEERAGWLWATNLPSVISLKNAMSICHSRWQIENKCFNEIVNTWNGDHIYRHSQNAISAFILFLFIVLNIFNIFFSRNIKDKRIKTKSFLIELIKAEFLLTKWTFPIPP